MSMSKVLIRNPSSVIATIANVRLPVALIIEDDKNVAAVLHQVVCSAGFSAKSVVSAEAATDFVSGSEPDLVLLDLLLPGISGDSWLRTFRLGHSTTLVIAISGITDPHRRAELLYAGADDFVQKPFNVEELTAKIVTVYRRRNIAPNCMLCDGFLTLDPATHLVAADGLGVRLTATEFSILWNLASQLDQWVDTLSLTNAALGSNSKASIDDLRVHVSNIRLKINPFSHFLHVDTKRGFGYRLSRQKA